MRDDQLGTGAGFVRRTVVLEPGTSRPSHDAEWRDALVLLVQGDVDLECAAGGPRRFPAGAGVWRAGVVHNVGVEPVVLLAVSRSRDHPPH